MGSDMGNKTRGKPEFIQLIAAFVAGVLFTIVLLSLTPSLHKKLKPKMVLNDKAACEISFGTYKGKEYSTTTTVRTPKCLIESKFLKVQQHAVQFDGNHPVIEDWIWIDYHDRINAIIEVDPEPRFLVFQQTKYALGGQDSLAIVGGIIEPGEEPKEAAHREVLEESSMDCQNLQFLGSYRTDVNRGMGWTYTYLARECEKATTAVHNNNNAADVREEVGAADTERQDLRIMSLEEVRKAVRDGKFLEIQWSATVALAMLYYDDAAAPQ